MKRRRDRGGRKLSRKRQSGRAGITKLTINAKRANARARDLRKRKTNTRPRRSNRIRAVRRKLRSRHERMPTTAREYFSQPQKVREIVDSVAHSITKMRAENVSLQKAAKEFGIHPDEVLKLGHPALRKQRNGRYVARKTDRLLRIMSVLTPEGRLEVAIRDSRQASLLGKYWAAVQRYLQTGDDSALREFEGKKITDASRKRHALITDVNQLNTLGSAGVLSFESLYAGVR